MKQQLCIRKKGNNLWYMHNIQKLNMIQNIVQSYGTEGKSEREKMRV